jgi:hypothetical protein
MKSLNDMFNRSLFNYEEGDDLDDSEFAVKTVSIGENVTSELFSDDNYYLAVYFDRDKSPFLIEMVIVDPDEWEESLNEIGGFPAYLDLREQKEINAKQDEEKEIPTETSTYFHPKRTSS